MKKPLTSKSGEVRELSQADISRMRAVGDVLPPEIIDILPKRKRGERGKQKNAVKVSVTLRYSPEVVHYFKSMGDGWQKRMDDALKEWIAKHPHVA